MILPEAFRLRLSQTRRALLMVDYDGTLAAFRARRDRAYPDEGIREGLGRVMASETRLVVISGRETSEVRRLLGLGTSLEIWGCHGAERLGADGTLLRPALTAEQKKSLSEAEGAAKKILPEEALERKPLSLAGHFRPLPSERRGELEAKLREAWEPFVDETREVRPFDGGLEFRFRAHHKGQAVAALLDEEKEAVAAYVGDDETDEDAFRALRPLDLALLVAEQERPTAASLRIGREDVARLLHEWAALRERRKEKR